MRPSAVRPKLSSLRACPELVEGKQPRSRLRRRKDSAGPTLRWADLDVSPQPLAIRPPLRHILPPMRPIPVLTPEQSRAWDASAEGAGRSLRVLMETAGRAVAQIAIDRFATLVSQGVLVACGPGNNGGDGWVAARALRAMGLAVWATELVPPECRHCRRCARGGPARWCASRARRRSMARRRPADRRAARHRCIRRAARRDDAAAASTGRPAEADCRRRWTDRARPRNRCAARSAARGA